MSHRVELGAGTALLLDRAPSSPASSPPDLAALPGAEWVAQGETEGSLSWACVRAPAPFWIDGLEAAVLDGASAMARAHLGLPHLSPAPLVAEPWGHSQRFEGAGTRGRHLLGFDEAGAGVLCTLVCSPPCSKALGASRLEGARPSPGQSAVATLLIAHPEAALAVGCIAAVALASLALWRRPRPRFFSEAARAARRRTP